MKSKKKKISCKDPIITLTKKILLLKNFTQFRRLIVTEYFEKKKKKQTKKTNNKIA